MQEFFEVHQLVHLALHEASDWDAGPLRDNLGDVVGINFFFQHPRLSRCRGN